MVQDVIYIVEGWRMNARIKRDGGTSKGNDLKEKNVINGMMG